MAIHPALALQNALLAALRADAKLKARLGGARVFDAVPPRAAHPYIAYGPVTVRDWSTGSGPGHEHLVTISVFSREAGFAQTYALVGAITDALEGALPALDDYRLVLLRFDAAEFRRDPDGIGSRGAATFRALTEPSTNP